MVLQIPGLTLSMARNLLVLVSGMDKGPWSPGVGKMGVGKVSLGEHLKVGLQIMNLIAPGRQKQGQEGFFTGDAD